MASQAQLESQIASLEAQIAEAEASFAALREAGDDPAGEAELESYIAQLEDQLFATQDELQNLTTLTDEQLAALGDAQAGPGEASYFSPPPDDTIYYENDGTASYANSNNTTLDDGSDPYVSNGVSTIRSKCVFRDSRYTVRYVRIRSVI